MGRKAAGLHLAAHAAVSQKTHLPPVLGSPCGRTSWPTAPVNHLETAPDTARPPHRAGATIVLAATFFGTHDTKKMQAMRPSTWCRGRRLHRLSTARQERLVVAVVDGHGGDEVVRLCKTALPSFVDAHTADVVPTVGCSHFRGAAGVRGAAQRCRRDRVRDRARVGPLGCANMGRALRDCGASPRSCTRAIGCGQRGRAPAAVMLLVTGPPRLYPGGLSCSRCIGDYDCPRASCSRQSPTQPSGRRNLVPSLRWLVGEPIDDLARGARALCRVARATQRQYRTTRRR